MKIRLIVSYIVIVVFCILFTGIIMSYLEQNLYKDEVKDKLASIAVLSKNLIIEKKKTSKKIDYNSLSKLLSKEIDKVSMNRKSSENVRVTFISKNGKVLGDSVYEIEKMENHLGRKEVLEALNGKIGYDIRMSNTLKIEYIYVAILLDSKDIVLRVSLPLEHLKSLFDMIYIYLLISIVIGGILSLFIGYQLSRNITNPVRRLIDATVEIASGKYNKRVYIESKDELGQLGETFNKMASELEYNVEQLMDKNHKINAIMNSIVNGIIAIDSQNKVILMNSVAMELFGVKENEEFIGRNIAEVIRKNKFQNLLAETVQNNSITIQEINFGVSDEKILRIYANPISSYDIDSKTDEIIILIQDITEIRKLEQIKTEFVSNVTHELKTPLTSIRGFVETLRGGAITNPNVAERFLEIIDIEVERLYMLINDILHLSEIETMQRDTNISTQNLGLIIDEVISILTGVAERKKVIIVNETSGEIFMEVNRDRIKQLLINLIENAVKYNIENGVVKVCAKRGDGMVELIVEDTGIGIPNEHLPRIFERFYRVDKGRARNLGGTGLGLSIVKHIVNLYNGDIKITSQPEVGTKFHLRFPD